MINISSKDNDYLSEKFSSFCCMKIANIFKILLQRHFFMKKGKQPSNSANFVIIYAIKCYRNTSFSNVF